MFFRPQEIDEAARRRLVKRLYIPLPDASARRQIVTNLMKEQPYFLSDEEMEDICSKSEGKLLVIDINSSVYMYEWRVYWYLVNKIYREKKDPYDCFVVSNIQ